MRKPIIRTGLAAALLALAGAATAEVEMPDLELNGDVEAGKAVAMDRSRGNCIACHMMPGGESPGAIGPALIAMQTRYPSKHAVAVQVWDPTVKNPDVVMPPFGKHGILSEQEFVDVVEYIWSL
jgi:sulfur-oxidizing protein SoxX